MKLRFSLWQPDLAIRLGREEPEELTPPVARKYHGMKKYRSTAEVDFGAYE